MGSPNSLLVELGLLILEFERDGDDNGVERDGDGNGNGDGNGVERGMAKKECGSANIKGVGGEENDDGFSFVFLVFGFIIFFFFVRRRFFFEVFSIFVFFLNNII
jgi:hypothetical protein